ncbi:GNAT family N-acetyltransferase [uncultured Parabacteroides sp.]|uniref:GNAT family N-acetyltransferase n=1 Tax=uncultured Parabacteroides sp. TaxID=512312 RepID=UPI00263A3768|nr:GNAT family N-acetyltransferase [uncultured Parabacteroides sp.]
MEVTIRPQRASDAEYSWQMRKDKDVWKYAICESPYLPLSLESETTFYQEQIESSSCLRFAILADNIYIGNVFIDRINNSACRFGELHTHILNKSYWGKGIGYECNRLILEYAFRIAKMKGVYQYINPGNVAAWKNALKLGFNDNGTSFVRPNVHILTIRREQWIKE